nr:unnamed protein product [Digitaria exilis]
MRCFRCRGFWHLAKDCRRPRGLPGYASSSAGGGRQRARQTASDLACGRTSSTAPTSGARDMPAPVVPLSRDQPLNLTIRPSKKGEILAMKHLGFLDERESSTSMINDARREFDRFFNEIVDVKNFPALRDLFPVARGLSDEELLAAVQQDRGLSDEELLAAVGTVLNAADARKAIGAGAQFLMSPGTVMEILHDLEESKVLYIPGVMTPTEVLSACRAGAKVIKVS